MDLVQTVPTTEAEVQVSNVVEMLFTQVAALYDYGLHDYCRHGVCKFYLVKSDVKLICDLNFGIVIGLIANLWFTKTVTKYPLVQCHLKVFYRWTRNSRDDSHLPCVPNR